MSNLSLIELLVWVKTSGAAVITTAFASWLVEYWPWWRELDSMRKRMFMVLFNVLIATLAWAILTYVPAATLAQLEPIFAVVATAVTSILGTQLFHSIVNKPKSGATSVTFNPNPLPAGSGGIVASAPEDVVKSIRNTLGSP